LLKPVSVVYEEQMAPTVQLPRDPVVFEIAAFHAVPCSLDRSVYIPKYWTLTSPEIGSSPDGHAGDDI
jgi:hypothetical protein